MTTCKLRQSILLATVLAACLALALARPAYAAESSATGDVWSPSVTVTTDKASYAAGERGRRHARREGYEQNRRFLVLPFQQ